MESRAGRRWRAGSFALALLALGVGSSGCYAEARTSGVVTAEYAPAHVEVYPSEYYDGRVVYLVGDRWYYQSGPHWVYYQREPAVLVQRRVVYREAHVVHRAPAVRERTVVHEAPPVRRDRPDRDRGRAERRAPERD